MEKFKKAIPVNDPAKEAKLLAELAKSAPGLTPEQLKKILDDERGQEFWINDKYQVVKHVQGNMVWLSIRRLDRETIHDWRELQAIKNELVGPEFEAVELYPAESRLVDGANQYHLWAVNDASYRFPFGFNGGRAVDYSSNDLWKQRGQHE
jgi:hypothetical protein